MLSNSMFPSKHVRNLDLLDGTPESPQEQPHKSRMTLMSPKECKIFPCNPNQFEMTPDSPILDLVQSPVPHHTRQVACLTLGNYRDSLVIPVSNLEEHQFQHRNTRKAPWTPYHLEKRVDSQDSIEEVGQLSTSTSRVPFPQQ